MPGICFAWAGGTITEQQVVVTNGTTHGASPVTRAIVGDTASGSLQLINIADVSGLEVDAYYEIAGPGIAAGTRFLYDDTILSGLPTSLNLDTAPTSVQTSATFTATRAVALGTALGTLTAGSDAVTLTDMGGLPAGTYQVIGTGIGETDAPIGTTEGTSATTGGGTMFVSACLLIYDGAGGGRLAILAATPSTTEGTDDFDQPTKTTTYTVTEQEVRATSSGTYPLALSGFSDEDPASITDIPATALASLEPGLQYNISGNGIPVGCTFVAPVSGTDITLDLDATASELDAILTITGPRTPNAPFDSALHNRFDEDVLSFEIAQEEGGFATLMVDIKNPNIGLLALGRNLWCWLSWDSGTGLVPLFNGRLVGIPKLQAGEIVQLQFLGRPDDFNAQKAALAETLKVLPYYDPIWLAADATADTALETRSALWHTDRVSLALTTSDILEGEAGIIDVGEDVSIYDRFSLSYGQPPLVATTVSGTVTWQQQAEGVLDVTQALLDAFYAAGSGYRHVFTKLYTGPFATGFPIAHWSTGGGGLIQCLCDGGIKSDWPRPGTSMGGGWSLSSLADDDGASLCYIINASKDEKTKTGWLEPAHYTVTYTTVIPPETEGWSDDQLAVGFVTAQYGTYTAEFPLIAYKIRMNLEFRANRKRTEVVTAVVAAGVQRELSDSAESDRESISLTSQTVAEGVDPEGALPIGALSYRSYFQTERGASSFEYLLLAARAKMRARARAVDITFAVPWATALPITMRHSVRYTDRRLPGGIATGKVKSYKLTVGDGTMTGEFTIGCSIGTGDIVAPQAGAETYVNAGYVQPGYQIMAGAQTVLLEDEIAYQTLDDFVVVDDGLDLTNLTVDAVVNECVVTNGMAVQMAELDKYQNTLAPVHGDPISTMSTLTTTVLLDLKPVAGAEYHTGFFPAVTPLTLPKTIDLAAPAGG